MKIQQLLLLPFFILTQLFLSLPSEGAPEGCAGRIVSQVKLEVPRNPAITQTLLFGSNEDSNVGVVTLEASPPYSRPFEDSTTRMVFGAIGNGTRSRFHRVNVLGFRKSVTGTSQEHRFTAEMAGESSKLLKLNAGSEFLLFNTHSDPATMGNEKVKFILFDSHFKVLQEISLPDRTSFGEFQSYSEGKHFFYTTYGKTASLHIWSRTGEGAAFSEVIVISLPGGATASASLTSLQRWTTGRLWSDGNHVTLLSPLGDDSERCIVVNLTTGAIRPLAIGAWPVLSDDGRYILGHKMKKRVSDASPAYGSTRDNLTTLFVYDLKQENTIAESSVEALFGHKYISPMLLFHYRGALFAVGRDGSDFEEHERFVFYKVDSARKEITSVGYLHYERDFQNLRSSLAPGRRGMNDPAPRFTVDFSDVIEIHEGKDVELELSNGAHVRFDLGEILARGM